MSENCFSRLLELRSWTPLADFCPLEPLGCSLPPHIKIPGAALTGEGVKYRRTNLIQ